MAQLRITVIRRDSNDSVVSACDAPLFCDRTVGVSLEGPLETLLRNVSEYAHLTDPKNVSLELVLDQRQDGPVRRSVSTDERRLAGVIPFALGQLARRVGEVV